MLTGCQHVFFGGELKKICEIYVSAYFQHMKASKREHEKAVRTTVSFPALLVTAAEDRMRKLAFPSFSAYLQNLVRLDAISQAPHGQATRLES